MRPTYLSSDAALSDIEIKLIMNQMQRISIAFIDVNSVKFAYGAEIEEWIYVRFAKTHLCG